MGRSRRQWTLTVQGLTRPAEVSGEAHWEQGQKAALPNHDSEVCRRNWLQTWRQPAGAPDWGRFGQRVLSVFFRGCLPKLNSWLYDLTEGIFIRWDKNSNLGSKLLAFWMFSMTCLLSFLFDVDLGFALPQGKEFWRQGRASSQSVLSTNLSNTGNFTIIMHITAVPAYIALYNLPDIFYGMKEYRRSLVESGTGASLLPSYQTSLNFLWL